MKAVLLYVIFSIAKIAAESKPQDLLDEIVEYYKNATVNDFEKIWEKHRVAIERSLELAIADSFGSAGGTLNVYIKKEQNPQQISPAILFHDSINTVLLVHLFLREVPHLLFPDLLFHLPTEPLRVETPLSKIFIEAKFVVFRNSSTILYETLPDPLKNSPFSFYQVPDIGKLTIIGTGCRLVAHSVAVLKGLSVNNGHTATRLQGCNFKVEIDASDNLPPLLAPYFSSHQRDEMQRLVSKALSAELEAKLEGALTSLINTTDIFKENRELFMLMQRHNSELGHKFASDVANILSRMAIDQNKTVIPLDNYGLNWTPRIIVKPDPYKTIKIFDATLNGLENLYAARRGGPVKLSPDNKYQKSIIYVADDIRFKRLQVRGKCFYKNETLNGTYDFVVEVQDLQVNLMTPIQKLLENGTVSLAAHELMNAPNDGSDDFVATEPDDDVRTEPYEYSTYTTDLHDYSSDRYHYTTEPPWTSTRHTAYTDDVVTEDGYKDSTTITHRHRWPNKDSQINEPIRAGKSPPSASNSVDEKVRNQLKGQSTNNRHNYRRQDDNGQDSTTEKEYYVAYWRSLEYILMDYSVEVIPGVPAFAIIAGYVNREIISAVEKHLGSLYDDAVREALKKKPQSPPGPKNKQYRRRANKYSRFG